MEWHEGIEQLQDHLLHISTPRGSGTGWLVSVSSTTDMCAIATAAHVVDYAHFWEEPIRVLHPRSGRSVLLRAADRAILLENAIDSAALIFDRGELPIPTETLSLMRKGYYMKPGVEIGWLGYPALHQSDACFFSGRVSHFDEGKKRYLVDGVAINGISGGPTFRMHVDHLEIVGIVSAYIANRATGETLPGLAVIQDATQFYDITERFQTLDEAKSNETAPEDTASADQAQTNEPQPNDPQASA